MTAVTRHLALLPLIVLALAACKDEARVATYTVPKETAATTLPAGHPGTGTAMTTATSANSVAAPSPGTPEWTIPATWREQPDMPMRKGTWRTGPADAEAEITVTVFPGDVGGLAANVGRWAGQIGLPAPSPDELKKITAPNPLTDSPEAVLVTLSNPPRALRVVSAPHAGQTWFIKLSGPAATVAAAEPDFQKFLASVKFAPAK